MPPEDLGQLVKSAYDHFHHDAVAPVIQLDDNLYFMELFHGPTLAFKDYALQVRAGFSNIFWKRNAIAATPPAQPKGRERNRLHLSMRATL